MFLTLIRHASASNKEIFRDFERPLTQKGLAKIIYNSKLMEESGWKPDLIISSSAVRALQTAQVYAETTGQYKIEDILKIKTLYLPEPETILDCIKSINNNFLDVFLFSHNSGISLAAQLFCNDNSIILPTGAAVRIKFDETSWQAVDFGLGKKEAVLP